MALKKKKKITPFSTGFFAPTDASPRAAAARGETPSRDQMILRSLKSLARVGSVAAKCV